MSFDAGAQYTAPSPPLSTPGAPPAGPANNGVWLPAGVAPATPWIRLASYILDSLLMVVTLWIGWLVWAAMIAGEGQTPAKRLLKLRVIASDTLRPIGLGRMFWMRGLVAPFIAGFAIAFTLGILLFMPFWDARKQNIWDKISGTVVVTDPNDGWSTRGAL